MKLFDEKNYPSKIIAGPISLRAMWEEITKAIDAAITALTIVSNWHESEIKTLTKKNKALEDRLYAIEQALENCKADAREKDGQAFTQ